MNGDSYREISIFAQALKVPAQERDAFLKSMCGSDDDLRLKVKALLRAHERLGDFLEEPPSGASTD